MSELGDQVAAEVMEWTPRLRGSDGVITCWLDHEDMEVMGADFDPEHRWDHYGMMRERMRDLGYECVIHSTPVGYDRVAFGLPDGPKVGQADGDEKTAACEAALAALAAKRGGE